MRRTTATLTPLLFLFIIAELGCVGKSSSESKDISMVGTWQLLTVLTIEGGDSTTVHYTEGVKGIKMLNDTHFSFFQHDLHQGEDSTTLFVSGGGPYTFVDGIYTEHLEYCNFRFYENHTFSFEVVVKGDTLVQRGEEEVSEADISKYIIETYVRVN